MKIEITACVIVKNEAKNIGAWLACMAQFADEIVVVDTGSTDETTDIVRSFAAHGKRARLYAFPWTGDFSAAKNFALGKAHGNWIAFLDADETFSDASIPRIRPLVKRLHPVVHVIGVMCRLVNVDPNDHNRFIGASAQLRLFRNVSSMRYIGRIHEALSVPKSRTIELVKEIEIIHTGYAASVVPAKLQRNLDLLHEKIAAQDGEPTPRDTRYLMDCYYGLGEQEKAIAYADQALARRAAMEDAVPHIHMIRVSAYLFGERPVETVLAAMDAAIADCPGVADFPMMKGLYLYDHGDYVASLACIERAEAVHAQYGMDAQGIIDSYERFVASSWWVRGRIAHLRGDEDAACEAWAETLRVQSHHTLALQHLVAALLAGGAPAADVIVLLNGLYDIPAAPAKAEGAETSSDAETADDDAGKTPGGDAAYLAAALEQSGGPVYIYYAARAKRPQTAAAYLAAGRYDAASTTAADDLDWWYKCGIADAVAHDKTIEDSPLRLLLSAPYRTAWQELAQGAPESRLAKAIGRMTSTRKDNT